MALSDRQKQLLDSYLNDLSKAELNYNLQSMSNMQRWLYKEHYDFYLQVKDKLDEVWDIIKSITEGILKVAGFTIKATAAVAVAPIYILGKIFGVIDD